MAPPSDHKAHPSLSRRCIVVNGPVIVGAGPIGLSAAARYRKRGVSSIVVLESASSIASLWQSKPHLSSKLSYPTKREFTARLESYAKKHEINPRFNVCVQSAKYDSTTRLWRVQTSSTSAGNEEFEEYFCKWLWDATGEKALRVTPEIDGLSQFEGPIIHARDYGSSNSGRINFRGMKVLVVGCGNSGMNISHDLLNHKAFPIMVHPCLVHVGQRKFLGFESPLLILLLLLLLPFLPLGFVEKLLLIMACSFMSYMDEYWLREKILSWVYFTGHCEVLNLYPSISFLHLLNIFLTFFVLINERLRFRSGGGIKMVPNIKRFNKGTVEFVNGEKLYIDAVVLATGYYNHKKVLVCNDESLKPMEGQTSINRNCSNSNNVVTGQRPIDRNYNKSIDVVSKKHSKVPRSPRRRDSFIRKEHAKVQTRPFELSSTETTNLTDKKKSHVSASPWRRKSQIGEENIISNSGGVTQSLVPRNPPGPSTDFILEETIVINSAPMIQKMIKSTRDGLADGQSPTLSKQGEGGAYFMGDSTGNNVSVFKPTDEEPNAVNNPRGRHSSSPSDFEGLKKGTIVGQGSFMEVAAYLLDHPISGRRTSFGDESGFAGVPPTTMVKCLHKEFKHPGEVTAKTGSLQMFVKNDGSCADFGSGILDFLPVEEVHRISVLDMRLANADRHDGNILLIRKENSVMVPIPIDHEYCLPTSFEDCTFQWLCWSQARQPYSSKTFEYIKSLDAEEDIALLKFHGLDLPIKCAQTLKISTMLLKKGAERGLTPLSIGSLMCRELWNKESVIEEIVQEALYSVLPGTSEATLLNIVSQIMDQRLDDIVNSSEN